MYGWIEFATASVFHSCELHFGALVNCHYGDAARCVCEAGGMDCIVSHFQEFTNNKDSENKLQLHSEEFHFI